MTYFEFAIVLLLLLILVSIELSRKERYKALDKIQEHLLTVHRELDVGLHNLYLEQQKIGNTLFDIKLSMESITKELSPVEPFSFAKTVDKELSEANQTLSLLLMTVENK